jgi:hypothetical protein
VRGERRGGTAPAGGSEAAVDLQVGGGGGERRRERPEVRWSEEARWRRGGLAGWDGGSCGDV